MPPKTIDVPSRGRKWRTGAFVRDGLKLYRVAGPPKLYHEDRLPMQRVTKVRQPPANWQRVVRLMEILQHVETTGTHTPESRGADDSAQAVPTTPRDRVTWEARERQDSYASYPRLYVSGDVLRFVRPIYDDMPIVTWIQDPALADEARVLISSGATLWQFPLVRVT